MVFCCISKSDLQLQTCWHFLLFLLNGLPLNQSWWGNMHNVSLTAFSYSQLLTKRRKLADRSLHSKKKEKKRIKITEICWRWRCAGIWQQGHLLSWGKQFIKVIAGANKLLLQLWLSKNEGLKKAIPEAIIPDSSGLVSVAILFSRDSISNAVGNMKSPPGTPTPEKWRHTFMLQ